MKQRLQKLVVLGLAVATVAGSSVPAYAAEIVPEIKAEATQEATEVGLTFPSNWNGEEDVVVKVDVDLTGATEAHFHGEFVDGVGDYGFHLKKGSINAKEGTVKITADTYRKAIQEQNELLKEKGMEPFGEMVKYSCSYVNILYADGSEKNCDVRGGEAIFNAKNPFFEGETNPDGNENAQAPTVQANATWNGSGDVVLQFNPNGLKEGSYFGCDAGLYLGDAETGYTTDEPEIVINFEAGTITVPEASLKAMIRSVEAWLEEAGNPQKFEWGTGELIFYFDEDEDGNYDYDILSTIAMTVKDEGTTDPEQKPDGDEAKADITIPSTWDGDLELKVDGVDLSKVELVYFHGVFQEGVPYDAGIRIGKENINVEKGTIVFPESILADAIKRQNEKLEALGMDKLGATVEFTIDDVYATLEDGNVVFFKDVAGKSLQCKNPLFKGEQKPGEGGNQQGGDQKPNGDGNNNGDSHKPSVKPQTKPEVKPQKDDTTTTPKTGDPSAVAGLLGTSIGSLGVALMAFKRRFRK